MSESNPVSPEHQDKESVLRDTQRMDWLEGCSFFYPNHEKWRVAIDKAMGEPTLQPVATTKGEAGRASAEGETRSSLEPRGEPQLVDGRKPKSEALGKGESSD